MWAAIIAVFAWKLTFGAVYRGYKGGALVFEIALLLSLNAIMLVSLYSHWKTRTLPGPAVFLEDSRSSSSKQTLAHYLVSAGFLIYLTTFLATIEWLANLTSVLALLVAFVGVAIEAHSPERKSGKSLILHISIVVAGVAILVLRNLY